MRFVLSHEQIQTFQDSPFPPGLQHDVSQAVRFGILAIGLCEKPPLHSMKHLRLRRTVPNRRKMIVRATEFLTHLGEVCGHAEQDFQRASGCGGTIARIARSGRHAKPPDKISANPPKMTPRIVVDVVRLD